MSTYGKRCARCQVYFATENPDDKVCLSCGRILSGSGQSTLIAEYLQS